MARQRQSNEERPVGEVLRQRRIEVLNKGLREMAAILAIAPAHLTDIEKGRRTPSEDLLMRIAKAYGIAEAELRAGWNRAQGIVTEVANQDALTADKVPEFLRSARKLSPQQWDQLIEQARRLSSKKPER